MISRWCSPQIEACKAIRLQVMLVVAAGIMFSQAAFANDAKLELKEGDKVLFLGSELIEQDIKHNLLEAALSAHWADRTISFRNMGWAGDDPTGVARGYFGGAAEGYKRLLEEVDRLKPSVIFVAYGENGAAEGAAGLPRFMENYTRLVNDLKTRTGRIIIVSPPPAERLPAPLPNPDQLNENRKAIALKLKEFAEAGGYTYVDLFDPIKTVFDADHEPLTYDTIRFNAAGYALIAETVLKQLNLPADAVKKPDPTLADLIRKKNDLYFHRYRPQNETYLRGFRQHEQGQNAKEISEFDPLIQRTEEQIAAFLQGKPAPPSIVLPEPAPLAFQPLSPEDQKATFKMAEGLQIELFAAEPLVANPIHMNFDSKGRLWVASSPIYPQLRPGATPSDFIAILEDTNGDGVADKKTIFADGLLIPTAVLPDEKGGAFIANSTELIHVADTDGDGIGDERRVLLSGFGTEDTHHILHTFRWSPDSLLCFNQSIYIHSQLETPYGVEQMLGSGIWRYRQGTARANTVMFGLVNPWGHIYDDWGQNFATDGAGGEGINYVFPGSAFLSAVGYDRILHGMNPGQPKHCGLEIVTGSHFPADWQNSLVAADFRGNRINRFKLAPQGSGYVSNQLEDLLTSSDRAFRPVDMKMGPDGALYIADWHDSIINHGEVDFRDPRRDDRHGRIWKVTVKGQKPTSLPNFEKATVPELLAMLTLPDQWSRQMARVHLTNRNHDEVAAALKEWVAKLDANNPRFEQLRLEALWVSQGINRIPAELLTAILKSPDHRARAAGVRALSQAAHEEYGLVESYPVLESFTAAVADAHPQVRLEAVNALRDVGTAQAAEIATRALDQEIDTNIDYALYLTMRKTQGGWLPRLESGEAEFANDLKKTLFVLKAIDNASALKPLMGLLTSGKIPADRLNDVLVTIGKFAGQAEVKVLFDRAVANKDERDAQLNALVNAAQRRQVTPEGDLSALEKLMDTPQGLRLIGLWKQKQYKPKLIEIVRDDKQPTPVRHGAIDALRWLEEQDVLNEFATDKTLALPFRRLAVINLIPLSQSQAATRAVEIFTVATEQQNAEMGYILDAFLSAKNGPETLAIALINHKVPPHLATLAIRKGDSTGARALPLVNAMRKAGGLAMVSKTLTPEELNALQESVTKNGDAARGQEIYRRKELACITCHSIGGAGGLVGPDMLSLGASSPLDYIIQSLLEPSAKIKEGYHTVSIATVDGKVINGVIVREGTDDLVIRDAQNKEVAIPKGDIDERANSPTSMMPADLTSKLPRDEFVDLVAFLSSLGKDGPYKVPQNRFVRRWKKKDGTELTSRVDGTIKVDEVPERTISFTINVTSAGKIGLKPNHRLALYLVRGDGNQDILSEEPVTVLDLPVGLHTFHLSMFKHRRDPVSIEIVDVDGSTGRAEPVNR